MPEITLADYAGFIYLELVKARETADQYSKAVAEAYARDPVMSHFPAPRFRTPKMTLTIPVRVAGVRFNQVLAFRLPAEKFVAFAAARLDRVLATVREGDGSGVPERVAIGRPPGVRPLAPGSKAEALIRRLHAELEANPEPTQPQSIVQGRWAEIFFVALDEAKLTEIYRKTYPRNDLYKPSFDDVLRRVVEATVVDRTAIDSLLVDPETAAVGAGGSVLTIQAEVVEEGVFVRSVRDPETGASRPVVEFE